MLPYAYGEYLRKEIFPDFKSFLCKYLYEKYYGYTTEEPWHNQLEVHIHTQYLYHNHDILQENRAWNF